MVKIKIVKVLNKIAKNGRTKLCSIKTHDKHGQEMWLSGFGNNTTEGWQDGQEVELEVFQDEYNGKVQWKFKPPVDVNTGELLKEISLKLDTLLILSPRPGGETQSFVEQQLEKKDDIKVEDIPF